jgi:hypothetical protein
MADFSLEDLEKMNAALNNPALGDFIAKVKVGIAHLSDFTREAAEKMGPGVVEAFKKGTQAAGDLVEKLGLVGPMLDKVREAGGALYDRLRGGVTKWTEEQAKAGESVASVGARIAMVMEPTLGIFDRATTGMGEFGKAGTDAGNAAMAALGSIAPILDSLERAKVPGIELWRSMQTGAVNAYALQTGLIGLAASQGQLSKMDVGTVEGARIVEAAFTEMADMAYVSAQATGQTVGAMMDLSHILREIPGALSDVVGEGNNATNQLVMTSQVAARFGRSQKDMAEDLSKMYTNMGLRGEGAFEAIARMYTAAGDSKLRFGAFNQSVMEIATSFQMLGDNTNATINVVQAFDSAFKKSDISPAAMQKVISGMAAGVEHMSRGTQAFISAQTGGPGGLAGAFKMEYAMQTGHMDEVMKQTMQAMQAQFGGQVLTLRDAAQNPALAGEFYKQVQYLTQVAGVAKDDREAYRILEAMQSGVMDILQPGAGAGGEGAATLTDAQERGQKEQARTTTEIVKVQQVLERSRLEAARTATHANKILEDQLHTEQGMLTHMRAAAQRGFESMETTGQPSQHAVIGDFADRMVADVSEAAAGVPIIGPMFQRKMMGPPGTEPGEVGMGGHGRPPPGLMGGGATGGGHVASIVGGAAHAPTHQKVDVEISLKSDMLEAKILGISQRSVVDGLMDLRNQGANGVGGSKGNLGS